MNEALTKRQAFYASLILTIFSTFMGWGITRCSSVYDVRNSKIDQKADKVELIKVEKESIDRDNAIINRTDVRFESMLTIINNNQKAQTELIIKAIEKNGKQ